MFRAIKDYDGSDSEKCISLATGDWLSSVHAFDTDWYIGHNERSGETGAFPASHVVERSQGKTLISGKLIYLDWHAALKLISLIIMLSSPFHL